VVNVNIHNTEYNVAQLVEALRYKSKGRGFDFCRSQWPNGLRGSCVADRLLELRVRIPLRAWKFVLCVSYCTKKQEGTVRSKGPREENRERKREGWQRTK
jgi:hypothetical protein